MVQKAFLTTVTLQGILGDHTIGRLAYNLASTHRNAASQYQLQLVYFIPTTRKYKEVFHDIKEIIEVIKVLSKNSLINTYTVNFPDSSSHL